MNDIVNIYGYSFRGVVRFISHTLCGAKYLTQ